MITFLSFSTHTEAGPQWSKDLPVDNYVVVKEAYSGRVYTTDTEKEYNDSGGPESASNS